MNDTVTLGALPTWDLDDLYPGKESTELARDLKAGCVELACAVQREATLLLERLGLVAFREAVE